ncbi:transcriptional regulator, TetR family [Haloechinothrix alba]|uniref:Transcriptional regulator, TetR family n=1 Tax=Haloechinothrix alba TaxID=664784 RepID=A0A239AC02_9PSEU|nr:TetR/AcrR family transcriptional regulator [Haloechinothrix alba]SNR92871.1 transcriptional regulator, TetR family [Haloechinothrix alba]
MAISDKLPVATTRLTAAQRRAQLAEAAARRFEEVGYHRVSMADVAADTGVTAPAVYRHFRSKQDLLAGAISSGLDLVEQTLAQKADNPLEEVVAAVAELVLDRRYLWTLLQREARFLNAELYADVQAHFDRAINEFIRRVRMHRPGLKSRDARLLVTAATSALATPSVPRSAPRSLIGRELAEAATRVLLVPMPTGNSANGGPTPKPAEPHDGTNTRRTKLLDTAIELFFHQGYAAVSLDDIGAAYGIAGPSLYHHFATKSDILVAAFARATDRLIEEHAQPRAGKARSLAELVDQYTDFCLRNRTLVGIYVSEAINLPPDSQRRIKTALRNRVSDWSTALQAEYEHVEQRAARVRATTALTVIDDLVRLGHFHTRPHIAAEIRAVAMAILTGESQLDT